MINISMYKVKKNINSTMLPNTTAKLMQCTLKSETSIVNPILEFTALTKAYLYNYCYIPVFNRYYFINDWTWRAGVWIASCTVDVLASFKEEIGNQTVYVVRSTYESDGTTVKYNPDIPDTTYPATAASPTYSNNWAVNPFATSSGTYVVGIINNQNRSGTVTYYAFEATGFRAFCTALFNYSSGWLDIDTSELSANLQKALVNPFQYIVSCVYIPVLIDNITGSSVSSVHFGWWSVTAGAKIISPTFAATGSVALTIPKHPSAASRGNYLNLSPWANYTLSFYPFGTLALDSEALAGYSTLTCDWSVDVVTGTGILRLHVAGYHNPTRTVEALVGVPVPTASIQVGFQNLGKTSAISGIAEAASMATSGSGNLFQNLGDKISAFANLSGEERIASLKGAASNIASAALSASANVEISGQQGAASLYNTQSVDLSARFLPISAEAFRNVGRPLCQRIKINTLSDYIQCQDVEINVSCTAREQEAIIAFMQGGFFYQ